MIVVNQCCALDHFNVIILIARVINDQPLNLQLRGFACLILA